MFSAMWESSLWWRVSSPHFITYTLTRSSWAPLAVAISNFITPPAELEYARKNNTDTLSRSQPIISRKQTVEFHSFHSSGQEYLVNLSVKIELWSLKTKTKITEYGSASSLNSVSCTLSAQFIPYKSVHSHSVIQRSKFRFVRIFNANFFG